MIAAEEFAQRRAASDAFPRGGAQLSDDRRRYRRLQAPIYCRPAGVKILQKRAPIDMSLGGVRIYSDEPFQIGEALKLEVFASDAPVTLTAEVVWIKMLAGNQPAKFDVGLKFTQLDAPAMRLLSEVLGPPEEGEGEGESTE
jgi:hypothetical protein